jgi:hypothetical protein
MHGLIWEKGRDLRGFFDGRLSWQLCAVRLHKIIQPVMDADALHVFMRENIATGRLINFPLFHTDNIAQGLQASGGTAITGDNEFIVFLFCVGQPLLAVSQVVLVF